jgi:hypothetical protein
MDARLPEASMRFGVMAVVGFAVAALGQAPRGNVSQAQLSQYVVAGSGCPGQLQAWQQATGGATIWTTALEDQKNEDRADAKSSGLGVHVAFQGAKTWIKTLELRVSYEPLGLKSMPVAPGTNGFVSSTAEREKTFNLDREAATRVDADLLVGPAATITRVNLMSATFTDGSIWHAPGKDTCSVVPNRVVLVKAK